MPFLRRFLLSVTAALAMTSHAQEDEAGGSIKSGIHGRVIIATELLEATEWPVDGSRAKSLHAGSRLRYAAGQATVRPHMEPAPELLVVLEGARSKKPTTRRVLFQGMRFVPSQVLVPRPGRLSVENRMGEEITVVDENGQELGRIPPGIASSIKIRDGVQTISVKEYPFATATALVLDKARILPVNDKGQIPPIAIEGGDYKLAFYHGTKPLRVEPITVPDSSYIAIDASVSAIRVVDVTIKDGALQTIVRPAGSPPPDGEDGSE